MKWNPNPPHSHPTPPLRPCRCFQRLQPRLPLSSRRPSRGQGFVEFALILPFLLLLMLGIVEFGYVFAAYSGLFNAAREGVRYGVTNPKDVSGIVANAQEKVFLADPATVDIVVTYDSGPDTPQFTDPAQVQIGNRVLVNVTCDLPTITPVIQPIVSTLPVHTQAARTIASLGEGTWNPESGGGGGGGGEGEGTAAIALSVAAEPQVVYSGDAVQFTYVVTNTGDLNLTDVTILDGFGNTVYIGDLAVGGTAVRTVVENIATTTANHVMATGTDPDSGTVSAGDSVTVTVVGAALDLAVVVNPPMIYPGELVNFIYTVTNTGDANLTDVSVVDGFGAAMATADLTVGESVFWQVSYRIYETTVNDVTASGADPLGSTVSDSESVMVLVVEELDPIAIHEPLHEGSTVVSGTAHAGRTVYIRDLMSSDFPAPASDNTATRVDSSFAFTGLPPLVAGHVILVEGYGQWDSAVVGGDFDPIVINTPCHGSIVVDGTAEPGEAVVLHVAATGYQDSTAVDAGGTFTFTLPADQPLQAGQTVEVSGYGEVASAVVEPCTTDAYIVITPQCGPAGEATITINGYNWRYQSSLDDITIKWDGATAGIVEADAQPLQWETQIIVDVTARNHQVSAVNMQIPEVMASFASPCPAPNLRVTHLSLLTSEPISTYQPLAFSVAVKNVGSRPVNNLFWVDLYSSQPTTQVTGIAWAAVSGLGAGDITTLTVPFQSGFEMTGTYAIWAFADSWNQVSELDEQDNDRGPVLVEVSQEGAPPPSPPAGTGGIAGETWVSMTGIPVPHGRTNVRCLDGAGQVIASTTSDDTAKYTLSGLPAGTYTVIGETWIDGVRYSRTLDGVVVNNDETTVLLIILYRE
ncbi:MAG TPA: TadE/TadG family type IV pilus assembly protein [Anaerolineae bacterium]|nr:TadE/TadG family type IV pilus assembly protein [Anaerolineae bacterium]